MKKSLYIAFLLPVVLTGCKEDKYTARVTGLRLVSVDPKNGYPGDLVTLLGRNFSTDPAEDIVTIGGVRAQVLEAYKDRLLLILPENEPGQYPIAVTAPSGSLEGLSVNYLKTPDHEYLVTTVVGQQGVRTCVDGVGTGASTYLPTGINRAPDGTLWFTDRGGNRVRRIAPDLTVTTVVDASASGAAVWQGCFDAAGNYWFNDKANGILKRYSPADGKTVAVATGMKSPMNVAVDAAGNIYVPARDEKVVYRFDKDGGNKTVFAEVPDGPAYITFDPQGNLVAGTQNGYKIISIAPDGTLRTIVGDGVKGDEASDGLEGDPLTATIGSAQGIDFDSKGVMYFTDMKFHNVRRLVPDASGDYAKGTLETIMGGVKGYADGKGLNVKFNEPDGLLVYDDNTLYVCDAQNCLIRKVNIR